ncbi:MAG: phosphatase PAP2 family protein [Bdellovibrionaceae bacterium]|nr:phosphatase PAP2 family protein [Pseudobdellovibrionaceae bacterium]
MMLFILFLFFNTHAETPEELQAQEKIPLFSVVTDMPKTSLLGLQSGFSKESLPYWGLILSSTALLYHYDEDILRDIQYGGRKMGVGNGDNTHAAFNIGPWPVRLPTDTGSSLYFLGDGMTHFTIAGSLLGYGYFSDNVRPYNTGLQIFHGIAVSTFFSQVLKRSFGRESPYVKTKDFGAWRPFPTFTQYGSDTPKYDAMPSGHIMTATLTFTVLIENYPEHAYWLRPVEITWLSLLGWQMVNNGVHWASDYPLGIAMGYVFGKAAAKLGKKEKSEAAPDQVSWTVVPSLQNGTFTPQLIVSF